MGEIINWMNCNDGFLMTVITFVYVVATIFISVFNGKSAIASRAQIVEAQKQQKQNVGLQLYAKRKDVMDKLSKRKYDEIYWDVTLLFDSNISDSFITLAVKAGEFDKLIQPITVIEQQVDLLMPRGYHLSEVRDRFIHGNSDTDFDEAMKMLHERFSKEAAQKELSEYETIVKKAKELEKQIANMNSVVFLRMQNYIKQSIQ